MTRVAKSPDEEASEGKFLKIGECWYRHKSSGIYYALLKDQGRQIRRSLKTNDKVLAQRRVTAFRNTDKEADCLKRAFDYAVERGYLVDNPARHIKLRKVTDKAIVIPSKDDAGDAVVHLHNRAHRLVVHKDGGLLVAKTYGHLRDSHSNALCSRVRVQQSRGYCTSAPP